VKAFYS